MIQPLWRAIWQFPKKLTVHTHFISKSKAQRGNSSNCTSRPVQTASHSALFVKVKYLKQPK